VKFAVLALKLAITGALVWLLFTHVDFQPIGAVLLQGRAVTALGISVAILLAQAVLAAWRLRLIMRLMGSDLSLRTGFSLWMIGLFIGQTLVTFIAGDAARIWRLARQGHGRRLAGSAIFLERALGFAVLMVMTLATLPMLLDRADGAVRVSLQVLGALCVAGVGGFIASAFLSRVTARLAPRLFSGRIASGLVEVTSAARHLAESWSLTGGVVALSVIMHLLNAFIFALLGTAAHVSLDMVTTALVSIPVMLIGLLPIALAGWGVREGAAVVGYGLLGVPAQIALAISVGFGITLLISSLPGAFYLWFGKRRTDSLPP
jgi:uncharacterized protein (TIRG00374 family)